MACSNLVYLICCYDPDPTRSFLACTPNIDGVPNSSFTPGNTYVGIDPSFSPGVGITPCDFEFNRPDIHLKEFSLLLGRRSKCHLKSRL